MKELVRLRIRPSRDKKSFRYMLDYKEKDGKTTADLVGTCR